MKKFIAIVLIILGVISLFRYPNLGRNGAETLGAFLGIGLFSFLPAMLLIRSVNKNKISLKSLL